MGVRAFARAKPSTRTDHKVERHHGIFLGHRHIPIHSAGCFVPGGRYPMFGPAQIVSFPCGSQALDKSSRARRPSKERLVRGDHPRAIQAEGAGAIYILGRVPALASMAFGLDELSVSASPAAPS